MTGARLSSLLLLSCSVSAWAGPAWPDVKKEWSTAFEGSTSTSGVLRSAYCFKRPTVCVPKGSWVWFDGSFCSARSNEGCDDSGALPWLRAVDASAPITVEGLVFAPQVHRKLRSDEDEGQRVYSLRIDAGRRLEGLLLKGAVVQGLKLAPGRVAFAYFTGDDGKPTLGAVDEGTTAEATTIEGWQVPAGTTFRRDGVLTLSLSKSAKKGAVFARTGVEPLTATEVLASRAPVGVQTFVFERLRLTQPFTFAGASFTGEVTLARREDATSWESVNGTTVAPLTLERFEVPAASIVTLCADTSLEKATAPKGSFVGFAGRLMLEVRARREPTVPPQTVLVFFERCDSGIVKGYDVVLQRCPEERSALPLTLEGAPLDEAGRVYLEKWPSKEPLRCPRPMR